MAQLMFPNIAGQVEAGGDRGRALAFNRLAGLAVQNPDQAQNYLGQAAGINPGGALAIQGSMAQQQRQQQADQQAQALQQAKMMRGAALFQLSAIKSGDPNQIQGAHATLLPFLTKLAAQHGQPPPSAKFDPASIPALYEVLAQTEFLDPNAGKVTGYGPGTAIYQGTQQIGQVPFKPTPPVVNNGYQLTPGPDGKYMASNIPIMGGPQPAPAPNVGTPASPSLIDGNVPTGTQITQATGPDGTRVAFAFAPDTPDAVKAQAAASAGIRQGSTQSAPTTLAQAIVQQAAAKKAQSATDAGTLSDDAQQMLAAAGAQGYKIPIPAFGMRNSASRIDYLNDLAARIRSSGADWATGVHNMVYGETGLTGSKAAQRLFGQTLANERAVEAQVPTILELSNRVSRSGIPVLNKWILSGRQALAGDPDVTRFNNSVQEFAEEYAKVMSGSPTGAATDSARALAHTLITSAMTPQQFQQVMQTMQTMMQQRVEGQRAGINEQISGLANSGGFVTQPQQPQAAPLNGADDIDAIIRRNLGGSH